MRALPLLLVTSIALAEPTLTPKGAQVPAVVDCPRCHQAIARQWQASAHRRSSFDNPYYRVSVESLRSERGKSAARFCAGCHEPVLFSTGTPPLIDGEVDPASPEAQAGVGCIVCHSIDAVDLEGNGGWHATLGRDVHGRRQPILDEAKLCAACHKVGLRPDVTHDRWQRGQDDWDAWLASSSSGNGASAVYRKSQLERCQDCHMPFEPADDDAAAHELPGAPGTKVVRSHRFVGANAALAHLRGDGETERRVAAFLRGAVALDLFLDGNEAYVVLANRRVGHRFPGGTNDSNEVWLEVTAFDAGGRVLGRSGGRDAEGVLDADTHLVRAQPVDGEARPLMLRDPQHQRGVAFDTSLGPGDPQAVRYRLPDGTARVEAHLYYRKFSPAYAARACPTGASPRCREVPIVEVAQASAPGAAPSPRTLVERALALAGALVDSAARALPFVEAAARAAPNAPEPLLARARLMLRLGRTDDAVRAAERAARLAPAHPAAPLLAALALERGYRQKQALPSVMRLGALVPDDRVALALSARVFGVAGDAARALACADRLAAQDPDLDEAHYQRALALDELGRADEARAAETEWLSHRVADEINLELRGKLRDRHPQRPDESEPVHLHLLH